MSEIIITDETGKRSIKITDDGAGILLGRSEECGVALKAQAVSRKHARIFKDGSFYFIEDLGSTNGTFVNGAKIVEKTALAHRDEIAIGRAKLEFYDDEGAQLEDAALRLAGNFHGAPAPGGDELKTAIEKLIGGINSVREKVETLNGKIPDTTQGTRALKNTLGIIASDLAALAADSGEIFRAADSFKRGVSAAAASSDNAPSYKDTGLPAEDSRPLSSAVSPNGGAAKDYARVLEEINDIIRSVDDYKKAARFILSVAMKIIDTNRGFIVVKDPTIGSIMPLVSEIASSEFAESSPSMLVARYAVNNREEIIVDDPMLDERFMGMSESIVSGVIKSVICLPLIKKGVAMGAIYMDNTRHRKSFSAADRQFIAALCEKVSVLLEKSGLYGDLIEEYEQLGEKESRANDYALQFDAVRTGLIIEGIISESDAEKVAALVKRDAKSPILCILDEGVASFAALEPFFIKNGKKRVKLSEQRVTASLAHAVPLQYALARAVVPFGRTMKKELYLAMADPFDARTVSEVESHTGCTVEVYYCEKEEIVKTLKTFA